MHKFLQLAIDEARNHVYDQGLGRVNYRLACVIARAGNVLTVGFNDLSTNGFVKHYARLNTRPKPFNTHAELDAICRARNKIDLTGTKAYIARIRCDEDPSKHQSRNVEPTRDLLGMARPCTVCETALFRYGLRRAFYTIDELHHGVMSILPGDKTRDRVVRVDSETEE